MLFCAGGGERTRSTLIKGKRWKFEGGKKKKKGLVHMHHSVEKRVGGSILTSVDAS